MLKNTSVPRTSAANFNLLQIINFQTYQWLPRWQPWLPNGIFLSNVNRKIDSIAWHSRYPTVQPHTHQYMLLRNLADNNLEQVVKILKKTSKSHPNLINSQIDKKYQLTPLQYASVTNNYPAIELFLLYGANINQSDRQGNTPLMLAVKNQCLESINTLLKAGSDWRIKNKYGLTPELKAQQMGRQFISLFIKDYSQQQKKNTKKQQNLFKRKFPRFRVKLDIEDKSSSPFWNFIHNYGESDILLGQNINKNTKKSQKPTKQDQKNKNIKNNPFNNFSGEYRIAIEECL